VKVALLLDSILPPANYGGTERVLLTLANTLKAQGHQVVVAARPGSVLPMFEMIPLPEDYKSRDPKEYLPHDVEFLHSHQPLPRRPSLPFLVTIHGNGQVGEHFWANTNFLSQSHARNHSAKYYVYNSVESQDYEFTPNKDLSGGGYFVFLARTTWRVKNLRTAIDWANDLGVRLEIMGGSGISRGRIRYHGLVGGSYKMNLLKNARALIFPTNWDEPFGLAPLEALACGTPVISSANGCLPELLAHGGGVICQNYQDLLSAPNHLQKISPALCRSVAENFFNASQMTAGYLNLYQKILNIGDLDQQPRASFKPESVKLLYKPNFRNRLSLALRGKI
jgi:glycosyltransferase involved in cell wall biosynthesis